jgi:Tfp pilus assembly protein PilX
MSDQSPHPAPDPYAAQQTDPTQDPYSVPTSPPSASVPVLGVVGLIGAVVLLLIGIAVFALGTTSSSSATSDLDDAQAAADGAEADLAAAEEQLADAEADLAKAADDAAVEIGTTSDLVTVADQLVESDQRLLDLLEQQRAAVDAGDFARADALTVQLEAEVDASNALYDQLFATLSL